MSLIPSESLNFPDNFRAKEGWSLPPKSRGSDSRKTLFGAKARLSRVREADLPVPKAMARLSIPEPAAVASLPARPVPSEVEPEESHQLELIPKSADEFGTVPRPGPEAVLAQLFR